MKAIYHNGNRSAVAVEGGIGDELVINRPVQRPPDFEVVAAFQHLLPALSDRE